MTSTSHLTSSVRILKTVLESSSKRDLTSLNNIIFLAQYKNIINLYNDFYEFGKIGVSSPKLGLDYNFLLDEWNNIETEEDQHRLRNFGKDTSEYDSKLIGLLIYYLFRDIPIEDTHLIKLKEKILQL